MVDDSAEEFVLKLVGNGINIDKIVNKQVAMVVATAVFSGGAPLPTSSLKNTDVEHGVRLKTTVSLREFLTDSRASSNAEQITAFGYYICEFGAKDNFSKDDLKQSFRSAREKVPANLPRDLGTSIKSNWIAEAPGQSGHYYVTHTGMQLVESKFGRLK